MGASTPSAAIEQPSLAHEGGKAELPETTAEIGADGRDTRVEPIEHAFGASTHPAEPAAQSNEPVEEHVPKPNDPTQ
jgi:hypothetical protein